LIHPQNGEETIFLFFISFPNNSFGFPDPEQFWLLEHSDFEFVLDFELCLCLQWTPGSGPSYTSQYLRNPAISCLFGKEKTPYPMMLLDNHLGMIILPTTAFFPSFPIQKNPMAIQTG